MNRATEKDYGNDDKEKNTLTDTMVGVLKNDYDDETMRSKRIEERENVDCTVMV